MDWFVFYLHGFLGWMMLNDVDSLRQKHSNFLLLKNHRTHPKFCWFNPTFCELNHVTQMLNPLLYTAYIPILVVYTTLPWNQPTATFRRPDSELGFAIGPPALTRDGRAANHHKMD